MKQHPLHDLAEVQTGYPFRKKVQHDPRGDVAVIQVRDIQKRGESRILDLENICHIRLPSNARPGKKLLKPGDILYMVRTERPYSVLVNELPVQAVALNSFNVLRIRPKAKILPAYLSMLLNQPVMRNRVGALMKQGTVPYMRVEDLRNVQVPVPSLERQRALVELEKALAHQCALHRELEQTRQQELNVLILENNA